MLKKAFRTVGLLMVIGAPCAAQNAVTWIGTDHHANFHTAGVVLTVSGDDNLNAWVNLEIRESGAPSFTTAHPLVRIDAGHFVGSLFGLTPDTGYEARVTLADPDGVTGTTQSVLAVATRPDSFPEPSLRTLYVATTGSDSNSGTDPLEPLLTIQEAANRSQPGDLVLIAPGVYRESVTVPTSGTATQPIVFRGSAPGAVLDGADETTFDGVAWDSEGNGVYSRTLGFSTGHVVTDQGRLYQYLDIATLEALEAGPPGGFFFNGTTLYVKNWDGSSPAARSMHVARHENGFYLNDRSHVRVEDMEIRHYGSGTYGKGVYLRFSSDCAVRSSRIHGFGSAGVWIKGGARNTIEGNELWDTSIFNWPWPLTKGSSAENNAVVLTDEIGPGNVIRGNTIHGTFNGIGPCGGDPPPSGFTSETDVYDNRFFDHTDDALEPEGYCANVRMWGNHIEDVHMAFAVAPAAPGPTWILRNIAYNFGNTRTSQIDGYLASALKINSGYPTPIGPLFLYHNTFLTETPDTSALELLPGGSSTYIGARNNVIAGTHYAISKTNATNALDLDWDSLWTTDPIEFAYWDFTHYYGFLDFQSNTGQELNGLEAPPRLTDPMFGVYTPAQSSQLIDRGLVIAGVNDDYEGSAPDIGAIESETPLFADHFESAGTGGWDGTTP